MASLQNFLPEQSIVLLAALGGMLALTWGALTLLRRRDAWLKHVGRKPLLTPNEVEFFHRLRRALPGYQVFPQVSFGAFLTDEGRLSAKARWSLRARFDRKIADYVICDRRSLAIVALIELDDRTHNARRDRERDGITKAAGYQTFRFQSKQKPPEAEIAALFQHARAWTQG